MNGRRAIVGLCMLCALLVSAFAAQSASAVTRGTTAFTCKLKDPMTGPGFSAAHCKPGDAVVTGAKFEHIPIAEGEKTHVTFSNTGIGLGTTEVGVHRLKSTIAGSAVQFSSSEVDCSGSLQNKKHGAGEPPEGEHYIHGTGIPCTLSNFKEELLGCTVTGITAPGGKEMVSTTKLTTTTTGKGHTITLSPESGTLLAEFELTGCVIGPITLKLFGSLTCIPDGATINCTHNNGTELKGLRFQNATTGPLAGYEGTFTVKGGKEPITEPTSPISVTTVETA
jgi:hypothetical protein